MYLLIIIEPLVVKYVEHIYMCVYTYSNVKDEH